MGQQSSICVFFFFFEKPAWKTRQESSICVGLLWRCPDGKQRQRGREWFSEAEHTHTAESIEKRDEWRSERECLNFGLNRPFRLELAISPISADIARVGANQRESGRVSAASARVGEKKKKETTWQTRHRCAVSGVPPASLRRTRVRRLWSRVRASQFLSKVLRTFLPSMAKTISKPNSTLLIYFTIFFFSTYVTTETPVFSRNPSPSSLGLRS